MKSCFYHATDFIWTKVGCAFERLVVEGRAGDMLVVMPEANFFWPDMNRKLLLYFVIATKIAKKVNKAANDKPNNEDWRGGEIFVNTLSTSKRIETSAIIRDLD